MAGTEAEVLEHVALIDEEHVDAHHVEVHHRVLLLLQAVLQLVHPCLQVALALLQTAPLLLRNLVAVAAVESVQRVLQLLQLVVEQVFLNLRRLRNLAELVVRHHDAAIVVVLHAVEEVHAVAGRVVTLLGEEQLVLRVHRGVHLGDGRDVRLHADNHRLVADAHPLHLVAGSTHNKRLAAAHLVVHDTAAQQHEHPDSVQLALVGRPEAVLLLHAVPVHVGERQVAAVVLRLHRAVITSVVLPCQFVLRRLVLTQKPVAVALANLLNLVVRQLHSVGVLLLQFLVVAVGFLLGHNHAALVSLIPHQLWCRVMQRMCQQVDTVHLVRALALHAEQAPDFLIRRRRTRHGIHINLLLIPHLDRRPTPVHSEEVRGEPLIDACIHPALTQIKVQLLKGYRRRHRSAEGVERRFREFQVQGFRFQVLPSHRRGGAGGGVT